MVARCAALGIGIGARASSVVSPWRAWPYFVFAGRLSEMIAFHSGSSFSWMLRAFLWSPALVASHSSTQALGAAVRIAAIAPCAPSVKEL